MRKTVLQTAVLCGGVLFEEGTPIEKIPEANRESVRLRYCHDVEVSDGPNTVNAATGPSGPARVVKPRTNKPVATPAADVPPAPTEEVQGTGQPPAGDASAPTEEPQAATPLPAMPEELLALLKAGGIETVEAAKAYLDANKSFRPLKGVGELKDIEIRKALGL